MVLFMKNALRMITHTVRPATVRDAKAIARVHASVTQALLRDVLMMDKLSGPSIEERQAYWREAIEYSEPQVQVAIEGETMVGFVGFDRSRDKGTPSTTGELWALCVLPDHVQQGIGTALWDAAHDGLKDEGCTKVTVWLPLRDERALRFFEHNGFKRETNSLRLVSAGSAKMEEIRLRRDLL
jgi:ribosomal protein S18 acetylase RimI-like enzyme